MLTHPRVHEKLLQHLRDALPDGQVPKHEDVKDIPYLTAVIEEGYVLRTDIRSWGVTIQL